MASNNTISNLPTTDTPVEISSRNHDNTHLIVAAAAEAKHCSSSMAGRGSVTRILEEEEASVEPVKAGHGQILVDDRIPKLGKEGTKDKQICPHPFSNKMTEGQQAEEEDQDEDEYSAEMQFVPCANIALSVASPGETSLRSRTSGGSRRSLLGRSRQNSRQMLVGNIPRHSNRNKKPKEISWLRDTLSLTSSNHSHDCRFSLEEQLSDDDTKDSFACSKDGVSPGNSFHQKTASSPAFFDSLESVTELIPKTPTTKTCPLPAIMDSSASEVSSIATPAKDDDDVLSKAEEKCVECKAEKICAECKAEKKTEEEEEEYKCEAPIKWITATIPANEENELPPPPPRDSRRDPQSSRTDRWGQEDELPRDSRSTRNSRSTRTGRWGQEDELPRDSRSTRNSRSTRADRWGQDEYNNSSNDRRGSLGRGPPKRTDTMPRGGANTESGGARERAHASRCGDSHYSRGAGGPNSNNMDGSGGRLYPTPPVSVAPSEAPSVGGSRRASSRQAASSRYRADGPRSRGGRPDDPRDHHTYDRHDDHSSYRRQSSPPRHGSGGSRYSRQPRDRYPTPRDRSPKRYPSPGDRPPERYLPPRDRSPERYPPPRDRSPERYPPRDRSPDRRHSMRGGPPPPQQQRWRGMDERSVYSQPVHSRRRDDPYYDRDYRRPGYDPDPYYGPPRGGRDDRRRPNQDDYGRSFYPRERSSSSGHSEVHLRPSHHDRPPVDDPYYHDRDYHSGGYRRSISYPEEDPYHRPGHGDDRFRRYSPRGGYPRDDPAYDDYPGSSPVQDAYGVPGRPSYPPSRVDIPAVNDRPQDRRPPQSPPPREQDKLEKDSRFVVTIAPPPPRQSSKSNNNGLDEDLLAEKLKSSGMVRKGLGGGPIRDEPVSVEIAPGVRVPLRRTQETMQAVAVDFYQSVCCLGCSTDIFCIADVSFVICCHCKIISPVTGDYFEGEDIKRHGLGLGFTCESLLKMQSEIVQERNKLDKEDSKTSSKKGSKRTTTEYMYERRSQAQISISQY